MVLTNGRQSCSELPAKLHREIIDVSTPLSVTVLGVPGDPDIALRRDSVTRAVATAVMAPGCGGDACHPRLLVRTVLGGGLTHWVLGTDAPLLVEVTVLVEDDPAYNASLVLRLPRHVTARHAPVECTLTPAGGGQSAAVTCRLPSPISARQTVVMAISTSVGAVGAEGADGADGADGAEGAEGADVTQLEFDVSVTALNAAAADKATLAVTRDVSIVVQTLTDPDAIYYGTATSAALQALDFVAKVQNNGVTRSVSVQLQLQVPAAAGGHLLLVGTQVQLSSGGRSGACAVEALPQGEDVIQDGGGGDGGDGVVLRCGDVTTSCVLVTCVLPALQDEVITLTSLVNTTALQEAFGIESAVQNNGVTRSVSVQLQLQVPAAVGGHLLLVGTQVQGEDVIQDGGGGDGGDGVVLRCGDVTTSCVLVTCVLPALQDEVITLTSLVNTTALQGKCYRVENLER
ncbi:uncharacterized protein LOC108670820 [Hyalella azteca]|uniref:Uncharacterized protein LOC108670820 n=1 Tax=Hyalella azteca TaxID=294128 RepID=A0A979FW27_HYAAZ|nr:uncharacterized protein LOC108670820 [Hyalella azteca]